MYLAGVPSGFNGTVADLLDRLERHRPHGAHGLQRSNADKRQSVAGMLALKPDWSDRAIAKHVGVTHPMVAVMRAPSAAERQEQNRVKSEANAGGVVKDSTPAPPPAAAERAEPEYQASAPAAPAPAPAPAADPDDDGPSEAELASAMAEHNDRLAALEPIVDADDKLAAAVAEITKLKEQNRLLKERVLGLTNEAAKAISLAKSWRAKCKRSGLA